MRLAQILRLCPSSGSFLQVEAVVGWHRAVPSLVFVCVCRVWGGLHQPNPLNYCCVEQLDGGLVAEPGVV